MDPGYAATIEQLLAALNLNQTTTPLDAAGRPPVNPRVEMDNLAIQKMLRDGVGGRVEKPAVTEYTPQAIPRQPVPQRLGSNPIKDQKLGSNLYTDEIKSNIPSTHEKMFEPMEYKKISMPRPIGEYAPLEEMTNSSVLEALAPMIAKLGPILRGGARIAGAAGDVGLPLQFADEILKQHQEDNAVEAAGNWRTEQPDGDFSSYNARKVIKKIQDPAAMGMAEAYMRQQNPNTR